MSITLNQLASRLEEDELVGYTTDDSIILPLRSKGTEKVYIQLSLEENGEYLQFMISDYLNLNATKYRQELLVKLLELSRMLKILKFGVDPEDGEVTVSIELPIEEGSFTQGQFRRCLRCIMHTAVQERKKLRELMETGIYPENRNMTMTELFRRIDEMGPA